MTDVRKVFVSALAASVLVAGCVGTPTSRLGMVKSPDSGLMIGSAIDGFSVTDPAFFSNKRVKVRIRNTSGDSAFDLYEFRSKLEDAYRDTGFEPTREDDFGLLVDLNVTLSGHVQTNMTDEYALIGAGAGGIAGYRSGATAGTATGVLAGATLGSIAGSFVTDDTYVIVADVTLVIVKNPRKREGKTITFSRSVSGSIEDEEDRRTSRSRPKMGSIIESTVAVFAGGRNTPQSAIVDMVRQRMIRIVRDII